MTGRPRILLACLLALSVTVGNATPAQAQSLADLVSRIDGMQQELEAQRTQIDEQEARIAEQRAEIDRLRTQVVAASGLADLRAAGAPEGAQAAAGVTAPTGPAPGASSSVAAAEPANSPPGAPLPDKPVGEAPTLARVETQVQAVPEGAGVLTRAGRLVIEPSIDYSNTSNNRLVFRGIELIPGIQVGLIEASDADRNTVVGTVSARYGLTNRIEVEARVPYLIRSDRLEFVRQREGQIVREASFSAKHLGDIEAAIRYQINRPVGEKPIFIASLRVKSHTGKSPYEIPFDADGIQTGLATGSGFWGIQPGVNFLLPSDPAVIFGGISYLYHMPANINKTVGGTTIGKVDPGDAINANIGFGFSLNPRFSFSLGYRHSYIFPTKTELGGTMQSSNRLQVGSMSLGMSYRITEKQSLNLGIDFGVTSDASDLGISLRMPFNF